MIGTLDPTHVQEHGRKVPDFLSCERVHFFASMKHNLVHSEFDGVFKFTGKISVLCLKTVTHSATIFLAHTVKQKVGKKHAQSQELVTASPEPCTDLKEQLKLKCFFVGMTGTFWDEIS